MNTRIKMSQKPDQLQVADPSDDPVFVEAAGEVAERLVELLDGPESVQPEQLLLQGPDESLDASVSLRLADEGRT